MTRWRLFYWARFVLILFAIFIVATAALDVSLAPGTSTAQSTAAPQNQASDDMTDVDIVVHSGGTEKVGGWLSQKVDESLRGLDDIRLEVRDVGSSIGDLLGR